MKRTAALRVTGEICFYFSILTLFPLFQRWQFPMAGFALACLVAALFAVCLRSMPLRLLLSLLPGACFLFAELHWMLIFPGLAWLYFILYLSMGRFGVALHDYRQAFRWMMILAAFVLVIQAINAALFDGASLSNASLAYLAAFVLLCVVAMRSMQMNAPADRRWHAANALTVAAALLLAVGVSYGLYLLASHSMPVLVFLFSPLRRFFEWLFGLIRFREAAAPVPTPRPPEQTRIPIAESPMPLFDEQSIAEEEVEQAVSSPLADQVFRLGEILIIAVLLLVAIWLVVKLARRGTAYAEGDSETAETVAFKPLHRNRKARTETVHGRPQTVRKLYREYLDFLRQNGLRRSPADTSGEILSESERISVGSAAEEETLRRVYLKARYSSAPVTDEDVAAARASLDAIRSRKQS